MMVVALGGRRGTRRNRGRSRTTRGSPLVCDSLLVPEDGFRSVQHVLNDSSTFTRQAEVVVLPFH